MSEIATLEYQDLRNEVKQNQTNILTVFLANMAGTAGSLGAGLNACESETAKIFFSAPFFFLFPSMLFIISQYLSSLRIISYLSVFKPKNIEGGFYWEDRLNKFREDHKITDWLYILSIVLIYGVAVASCLFLLFTQLERTLIIKCYWITGSIIAIGGLTLFFNWLFDSCATQYSNTWKKIRGMIHISTFVPLKTEPEVNAKDLEDFFKNIINNLSKQINNSLDDKINQSIYRQNLMKKINQSVDIIFNE